MDGFRVLGCNRLPPASVTVRVICSLGKRESSTRLSRPDIRLQPHLHARTNTSLAHWGGVHISHHGRLGNANALSITVPSLAYAGGHQILPV